MGQSTDRFMETAGKMVDAAAKTTSRLVSAGRDKVDAAALQSRLGKVQRQLGALVYTQHKTGIHNEEVVQKYIAELDRIQMQLAEFGAPKGT